MFQNTNFAFPKTSQLMKLHHQLNLVSVENLYLTNFSKFLIVIAGFRLI